MTKRGAIVKFCAIGVLLLLGVTLIFANFRLPFSRYRFVGFYGAIESKMGIDLKGGVLAVFDCKAHEDGKQPTLDEIKATETRLLNSLNRAGLTEATVQHQGSGPYKIRVEVPGLTETEEVFSAVGNPAKLDFRLKKADEGGTPIVDGAKKHISKVELYQDPNTFEFGVLLTLSKDPGTDGQIGADLFKQMIQDAEQYTYIYRNDELFSTVSVGDKSAGKDGTAVITLGKRANGAMPTRQDAEEFKMQIESGLFEVRLENAETSIIPQTLGDGALLGCIIALVLGILFMFVYMWVRYGDLGLLSNLSIGVFLVLFLFALAIVNAVQLTLPGIAGIVIAFAMAVDANIIIFERIKDEYQTGKRLAVAAKSGFDKSLWTIFDSNITTIIGGAVLFFLGTGPIKGFAITLILGVIISMFCCLVVTRSFVKLYLTLNPNNARRVKLEETNPYVREMNAAPATPTVKPEKRKLNFGGAK
jgi:preprotein translocase subunit SecD